MANPALRPRFLAPGDKLGKFDLIRQIAVGGMAELYLARTMGIEGFEKLVVVKRILPQFVENPNFVNMFLNEARLSATLHHPNIAQVYDIGVEEGDYFFSMEYVHGENLDRLRVAAKDSGVPVSLDAALTLAAGLCAGLHYAHEKAGPDGKPLNVVHRDVSPSNVLVSYDGGVKLVDFGIARAGSGPTTTRGGLKGKISYMSPEQCRGKAVLDRRSDIYSIGTLLYELTTGRLPFTDETEYGVLNQIVNNDVPPPTTIVADYPLALQTILMKALGRDPEQRFASALELQHQLEDFAHEHRLRVSPLVLARVMSTLFPARLEEWDHARAQGAFFVEQHVVRTLIESGKTSDQVAVPLPPKVARLGEDPPTTPVGRALLADEETTDLVPVLPPPPKLVTKLDTAVGPPPAPTAMTGPPAMEQRSFTGGHAPFTDADESHTLPGPQMKPAARALTPKPILAPTRAAPVEMPVPRAKTPTNVARKVHIPEKRSMTPVAVPVTPPSPPPVVPVVAAPPMFVPATGVLVSNPAADAAPVVIATAADITERVRVPTPVPHRNETVLVNPPSKSRLPLIIGLVAGLSGVAAFVYVALPNDELASENSIDESTPRMRRGVTRDEKQFEGDKPITADEPATAVDEPKPIEMKIEPETKVEPVEAKVEPETKVEPVEAKVEPNVEAKVETKGKPKTKATPKVTKVTPKVRPIPKKKIEPKKPVETKKEPKKEPAWNADSPFMPVRTDPK